MIEIIQGWSHLSQWLFGALVFATIIIVTTIMCETVKVLVRGWQPKDETDGVLDRDECKNEDNLSGFCIKEHDNCVTREECDVEISKRKRLPMSD